MTQTRTLQQQHDTFDAVSCRFPPSITSQPPDPITSQQAHSTRINSLFAVPHPTLTYTLLAISGSLLPPPPITVMSLYLAPPRQQQLSTPHM